MKKDQIVLKVGFFDELHCARILELTELSLPGNYAIQSATCDLKRQVVVFVITKGAKRPRVQEASPPHGGPLASLLSDAAADSEMLRLRTVHDVKEADAHNVMQAVRAVTRGFERPEDWHLVRCAHRPGIYVLSIGVAGGTVPDACVRAAARYKGVVDFDNKQLTVSVDKRQSDIF